MADFQDAESGINIIILKKMSGLKVNKSNMYLYVSGVVYLTVLNLSYYFVISRMWDYFGFLLDANYFKLLESYILLFVVIFCMPKSERRLSNMLLWLMILISYVPMLTVYALKDESRTYMYATTVFWIFTILLLKMVKKIKVNFVKDSQARLISYFLFMLLSIAAIVLIGVYIGFSINMDLNKVYEIRSDFTGAQIPFSGYLFNWLALIANPLFLSIFLIKKKWLYSALAIIVQLYLFSVTGNKIYLFAVPFVLLFAYSIKLKRPVVFVVNVFSFLITIGIATYFLFSDIWVSGLFANRTFLDQAVVSFYYHDFFSKNESIYLSSTSIFNLFVNYPYELDPPHLIGATYYNNPLSNVNSGIISDAFMNFGFAGFIIWPVMLALLLKFTDSFSKGKDLRICLAAVGTMPIILTNIPFFTSFFTNGLIAGMVFMYLMPKSKNENN